MFYDELTQQLSLIIERNFNSKYTVYNMCMVAYFSV